MSTNITDRERELRCANSDLREEIKRLTEEAETQVRVMQQVIDDGVKYKAEIERLKAELEKHCNCEFEGDENTKQCTLHNALAETLHEQANYRRERDALRASVNKFFDESVMHRKERDAALASEAVYKQLCEEAKHFAQSNIELKSKLAALEVNQK